MKRYAKTALWITFTLFFVIILIKLFILTSGLKSILQP